MTLDTEPIEARWFVTPAEPKEYSLWEPGWWEHPERDVRALLDEVKALREVIGEQRHIVDIGSESFGLQHPIGCRPNLLACPVGAALHALDGPPAAVGRYVVTLTDGVIALEQLA